MFDATPYDAAPYDATPARAVSALVLVAALSAALLSPDDDPFGVDPARTWSVAATASKPVFKDASVTVNPLY